MFEALTYFELQQYWWIIVSLLAGLLVFLMFVQGGQTLLNTLSTNEEEKSLLINSIGKKWELTYTTLVTFGGAMFAAFPLFYATSFGGAYWAWIAILFCFIIQAVSYEFRSKPGNFLGKATYDWFLFLNGSLGVILIGVAVGTFFTGSGFRLSEYNNVEWMSSWRGLEAAFNVTNLCLGFSLLFLSRILGAQYFMNHINHDGIHAKAVKSVRYMTGPFLVFFLAFLALIFMQSGFAYDPVSKIVFFEPGKYLNNMLEMPLVLVLFLIGVVLVLLGIFKSAMQNSKKGIWFSGIGTVLTVFSLFLAVGLNNTAFYPSSDNLQFSLTIENASSSPNTLTVMSYVSLLVPFVLAYIFYIWRLMDKKKLDADDVKNTPESY